jgi:beta-N-acetylhexosaminidase
VDKPLEALEQLELVPFKAAVDAGVTAVMTAHILFPQIEPDPIPATMSRRIMRGILREKLGFEGIIVSDCMEMAAIRSHYGVSEGTLAAFKAGVDLVEITHHPLWCADAAERLLEAVEAGELDLAEMDESVNRILQAKARWIENQEACDFDFAAAAEESRLLMEQTITEVQAPAAPMVLKKPLCIGCEPYRASLVGNVEEKQGNPFGTRMAAELGGVCADMDRDPAPEQIAELVARAKQQGSAVVGTFNAVANPGQLALIRALAENGIPTAVVALRTPYDLRELPEGVWAIAAYEYSPESICASAKVLRGQLQPSGKLPVSL